MAPAWAFSTTDPEVLKMWGRAARVDWHLKDGLEALAIECAKPNGIIEVRPDALSRIQDWPPDPVIVPVAKLPARRIVLEAL